MPGKVIIMAGKFVFVIVNLFFCILLYLRMNQYKGLKTAGRELLFFCTVFTFINNMSLAFILGLLNLYSLHNLVYILIIETATLGLFVYKSKVKISFSLKELFSQINIIMCVVLIFAGVLYLTFPTEYLWARRDPALYVINGVNMAETGGMDFAEDDFIKENYEDIEFFTDITYRGFYSTYLEGDSEEPGKLISQFLHYFSAALAIGYSLAGFTGLFAVNGIIGIFCLGSAYYLSKYLFTRKTSTVLGIFLLLNPAQLWCARIPQTELLYQLFYVLSVYMMIVALKQKREWLAFFSGITMGIIGLNRIDAYIVGIGVLFMCTCFILWEKGRYKTSIAISTGYILAAVVSIIYTYVKSPYYFSEHWDMGVLSMLLYTLALIFVINLSAIFLKNLSRWSIEKYNIVKLIIEKKILRVIFFFSLIALFLAVYFIRPLFQRGINVDWDFTQRALVEFCWYISIVMVPCFFIGLNFILKSYTKVLTLFPLLITGFASIIVYIYKPGIAPDHIWASRRWVSVCFVFVLMIGAYGIERIENQLTYKKAGKILGLSITAIISCIFVYRCRSFLFISMLSEMQEQYEELAENLDDDTVYFADSALYANILKNIYHKEVLVFNENGMDQLYEYIIESEKPIYYIGKDTSAFGDEFSLKLMYSGAVKGTYLVQKNGEYPTQTMLTGQTTNVYEVWVTDMDKIEDISNFIERKWKFYFNPVYNKEDRCLQKLQNKEPDTVYNFEARNLVKGSYRFDLDMDLVTRETGVLGSVILKNEYGNVLCSTSLSSNSENKSFVTMNFSCSDNENLYLEIRLTDEAQVKINDIGCVYIENVYDFLWDKPVEKNQIMQYVWNVRPDIEDISSALEAASFYIAPLRDVDIWELVNDYDIIGRTENYVIAYKKSDNMDIDILSDLSSNGAVKADFFKNYANNNLTIGKYIIKYEDREEVYYCDKPQQFIEKIQYREDILWIKKDSSSEAAAIIKCYNLLLGRSGNDEDYKNWEAFLIQNDNNVALMTEKFFESEEFKNRKMSSEEIIESIFDILYNQYPSQRQLYDYTDLLEKNDIQIVLKNIQDNES